MSEGGLHGIHAAADEVVLRVGGGGGGGEGRHRFPMQVARPRDAATPMSWTSLFAERRRRRGR